MRKTRRWIFNVFYSRDALWRVRFHRLSFIPHTQFVVISILSVLLINIHGLAATTTPAFSDPPCAKNIAYPHVDTQEVCPETIITYPHSQGIASITAMTFGPDGSLYLARPATREIIRIKPDSTGFIAANSPETQVQSFASNLPEPPNGLTFLTAHGIYRVIR